MAPELMTVKNNPNITNWSFEDGYERNSPTKDYPYRVFNAKQLGAFYTVFKLSKKHIEYVCAGLIEGFRVTLTMPGEIRKKTTYYFQVLFSEQAEIFVKPEIIGTSQSLRKYSPDQRQCFFNSERQLRFFKIYTQNNCHAECLSNFTQIECGCAKFSMPSKKQIRALSVLAVDRLILNSTASRFNDMEQTVSKLSRKN